jgi:stress response protein SCP2
MTGTDILLRRTNKILLPPKGNDVLASGIIAAFNVNLQSLGYTLALETVEHLKTLNPGQIEYLMKDLSRLLSELTGVRKYYPMYPDFPAQVMDASDAELYWNAILHYFSVAVSDVTHDPSMVWLPQYVKTPRHSTRSSSFSLEKALSAATTPYRVLQMGTEQDLRDIASNLVSANTSISEQDKQDLRWLIVNGYLPFIAEIPNKENLALIGSVMLLSPAFATVAPFFKTATDVLRLAVAFFGGDVSLAVHTKFTTIPRKVRKTILGLLSNCSNVAEDMLRWSERWKRLGERLHPGQYAKQYPAVAKAFKELQNKQIKSFDSKIVSYIAHDNWHGVVELLSTRPGDFSRRLDHMLRSWPDPSVVATFGRIAEKVSTPVLLQVMNHFKHRHSDLRIFFPKGNISKVKAIPNKLPDVPALGQRCVVTTCEQTLVQRFSKLPSLKNVFLDPRLENYNVPFSQRSASNSLRTLVRGSRVKIDGLQGTIRFFIYWKEKEERVDVDLSAMMFDENWQYKEHISYFNLRGGGQVKAFHSGDITSAPEGACEFIDVDIKSLQAVGGRYVIMCLNSFTKQNFSDMQDCIAGWMLREKSQSGEIFEPSTVQDRIDVTTDADAVLPLAIDVVDRKVIWLDMAYSAGWGFNNVATNFNKITMVGRAFTELHKPNLYDLLHLHAQARGTLVGSEEEADIVFSEKAGTQFQIAEIMSQYMADRVSAPIAVPAVA